MFLAASVAVPYLPQGVLLSSFAAPAAGTLGCSRSPAHGAARFSNGFILREIPGGLPARLFARADQFLALAFELAEDVAPAHRFLSRVGLRRNAPQRRPDGLRNGNKQRRLIS
jgi:hypothetical protein